MDSAATLSFLNAGGGRGFKKAEIRFRPRQAPLSQTRLIGPRLCHHALGPFLWKNPRADLDSLPLPAPAEQTQRAEAGGEELNGSGDFKV